jgi:NAD(P)-dependent dehydrogenase (short-subunit alcohol dehydrogenase family)
MRLNGKIAVVTGGGSGIGKATVERFSSEGATVIVADCSGREAEVAERAPNRAVPFNLDVRSPEAVERLFVFVLEHFGGLHVLFNNAGTDGEFAPIIENTDANFTRLLEINTRGVLLGIKHGGSLIARSGGGSIINTASSSALRAVPNMTAYAASKSALIGMTRSAAVELAPHKIRVNTICPGPIDTPLLRNLVGPEGLTRMRSIVPLGRLGTPEEVAGVATFLASDDSSFVTGASIPVDGGQIC